MTLTFFEWVKLCTKLSAFAASLIFLAMFAGFAWNEIWGKAACFGVLAILCNDLRRGIQ